MSKTLQEMTDEEFLRHVQSLPADPQTLQEFPKLLDEIRRRNGGQGLTRQNYRQLAEMYAESVTSKGPSK